MIFCRGFLTLYSFFTTNNLIIMVVRLNSSSSQNQYFYLLFIFLDFAISIKIFLIRNLQFCNSCNFRVPIHNFDFVMHFVLLCIFFCPRKEPFFFSKTTKGDINVVVFSTFYNSFTCKNVLLLLITKSVQKHR